MPYAVPHAVLDLKGIVMDDSCIEEFGYDLMRYDIINGSKNTFKNFYAGIASALVKNFGNGYAYRFANPAFMGAPKWLVEECSEKYRKLVPNKSKRVIRDIKDLGVKVDVITHDVLSLCQGALDELGIDLDNVIANDFSFHQDRVSGIIHDEDGWPRVHDKARILKEYMSEKRYNPKDIIPVGHGPEEISMARMITNMFKEMFNIEAKIPYRIFVPERGSYKELRDNAMGVYPHLERLPEMLETVFIRQGML